MRISIFLVVSIVLLHSECFASGLEPFISPTPTPSATPLAAAAPTATPQTTPAPPADQGREVRVAQPVVTAPSPQGKEPEIRRAERVIAIPKALPVEVVPPNPSPTPALTAPRVSTTVQSAPVASPPPVETQGDEVIRIAPQQAIRGKLGKDDELLETANRFYLDKDYATAEVNYRQYIDSEPNASVENQQAALWFLGECERRLNKMPEAEAAYQKLVSNFPNGQFAPPANFQLGLILWDQEKFKDALPYFSQSAGLAKEPSLLMPSLYYQAMTLEKLGRGAEGELLYRQMISSSDSGENVDLGRAGLARFLVVQKRFKEALVEYEILAQKAVKPGVRAESAIKAGLIASDLAQAELKSGVTDAAKVLGFRNRAVQGLAIGAASSAVSPSLRGSAQATLLHILYDMGQFQMAVDVFTGFKDLVPSSQKAEVLWMVAASQRQLGRWKESSEMFQKIVQEFPNSPYAAEASYQRLLILLGTDDPSFLAEADRYLQAKPDAATANQIKLLKADYAFKLEDYASAAAQYSALDSSHQVPEKSQADALYRMAYAYLQMKKSAAAVDAFTRFLKIDPTNTSVAKAIFQRGVANQQQEKYDVALKDFDDLLTRFKSAPERELALFQKGLVLGAMNNLSAMIDTFRTLIHDYPKSAYAASANWFIGSALFQKKDKEAAGAREALETAARLNPGDYGKRVGPMVVLCDQWLNDPDQLIKDIDAYRKAGYDEYTLGPETFVWLGKKFMAAKRYPSAEKAFTRAACGAGVDVNTWIAAYRKHTLKGAEPLAWLLVAKSQLEQGKSSAVVASVQNYLEAIGDNPAAQAEAVLLQGTAQLNMAKVDAAAKSADLALQLQPEGPLNSAARILNGDVLMASGRYDDASKAYLSVAILTNDKEQVTKALRRAADALQRAGKADEARKVLERLKGAAASGK